MARTTLASLAQTIEALRSEVTSLHLMLAQERSLRENDTQRLAKATEVYHAMRAEIVALKEDIVNVTSVASAINKVAKPVYVKPPYVAPQWQVDRATALAAAKAAAMAGSKSVRVAF